MALLRPCAGPPDVIDAHVSPPGGTAVPSPRRPVTPAALLAALPQPVEGIVLVGEFRPDAEAGWLSGSLLPCPLALIVPVAMAAPDAADDLAARLDRPGIVGICDAPGHADPGTWPASDTHRLESAAFRTTAEAAARLGVGLDLTISSFQAEAAARLARDLPELRLVVNHCGRPVRDGREARALWRDGLERLAEWPNVAIKLCDPTAAQAAAPRDWLLDVLAVCLDIFGPSRALYGSGWPAAPMTPAKWAGVVAEAIADLHPAAQARVWSGTARTQYFDGPRPALQPGPSAS